jgi:hypothetical protein
MLTIGPILGSALVAGIFATTPVAAYADRDYDDGDHDKDGYKVETRHKQIQSRA